MRRKLIMAGAMLLLSGCSGMMDKISNTQLDAVTYPAGELRTMTCIGTVATRKNYLLEPDKPLPGGMKRFTLKKPGAEPVINLDVQGSSRSTAINFYDDRRDTVTANDLDGILGYCKKEIG